MRVEDLEALTRAELQALAKRMNIKANQKSSDIISQILAECEPKDEDLLEEQEMNANAGNKQLRLSPSALDKPFQQLALDMPFQQLALDMPSPIKPAFLRPIPATPCRTATTSKTSPQARESLLQQAMIEELEEGTRVWTGSVYFDTGLFKNGFRGELKSPYHGSESIHSAIKSHFPYFTGAGLSPKTTGVVLILRSPFDAILAEFSRKFGTGGAEHRSQVSNHTLLRDYPDFFALGIKKWTEYAEFWLGANRMRASHVETAHGVTSYEFNRVVANRWVPVLVLFYEDFVRNGPVTMHRLFSFLKLQMGERKMPSSSWEALVCAMTEGRKSQLKEKRKHSSNEYNIYRDEDNLIGRRRAVRNACKYWRPFWFENVWGPCLFPVPQVKRLPIVNKDMFANVTEYCSDKEGASSSYSPPQQDDAFPEKNEDYAEEGDMT